jgi:polyhydroxybutyrate depolymerase
MKSFRTLFIILLALTAMNANAQWTSKTMAFGGLTRSYRLYVSPNYNASNPASIVMTLHGLGDNMTNFSQLGFAEIGDTANIIVICPQAVSDAYAGTAWNSGAGAVIGSIVYYPNSSVNDIGFLNALVDTTMAHYSVDPQKVYLTGFSMGGFMTERMAIQSNLKFAAFASMSGTMGCGITSFNPQRHIPIAHWHGTADQTVPFTGNQYGLDPDSLVSLWVNNNACNPQADTTHFADVVPTDSITVDMLKYTGADANDEVRFYIMYGCDHTALFPPTNDIDEVMEIWMFFRQHRWLSAGVQETPNTASFDFFPNPANDYINLLSNGKGTVEIFDLSGKLLLSEVMLQNSQILGLQDLQAGMYIIQFRTDQGCSSRKLVVR